MIRLYVLIRLQDNLKNLHSFHQHHINFLKKTYKPQKNKAASQVLSEGRKNKSVRSVRERESSKSVKKRTKNSRLVSPLAKITDSKQLFGNAEEAAKSES